ncbi:MAG: aldehyde dehydrogenase family protein [Alphaproteobacteria bacterium]|nr:aldehyde dehydrogenase family protein [Alphaproteobacteria bacterium]MDE2629516.1 aldehyde dehydrogenase family protein [Alphaproteobacteria bacterium]
MSTVAKILETMEYGPAPESSAPVEAWLDKHNRNFDLFIGGEWIAARARLDSFNPATGKKLASVAHASETDVDAAVKAARAAQPAWARLGGAGRARYLYAIARLIQKHSRLFAVLETMDNGKPIRETRDIDVPLTARHFYHHAGWAQLLESEFPDQEALGVAGQIVPWNFPLLILAWKIAPALAAGNTVVLKPSKETSLSALLFAEICVEARLPKGVVNIVTGPGKVGDAIVRHPDVDKIAFTGSTEVGRGIRMALAGTGKKLTLELGGKSPFVVFEDADLDGAVEGAVDAIWFNQGQVCCAGSRLLVQESVAERFLAKLRARMETLRVGDPLDKATDVGAIVSMTQRAAIDALVKRGVAEGAELFQPKAGCPDGCFYPPTLLTNVEPSSTVVQEEIFGPVLAAMSFRTPQEAVLLSNNTRYGLAASVWSEDINVALDLAPKIKAGVVWVNCTNQFDAACGFGGYRESGFGREGGREGMFAYLKRKTAKSRAAAPTAPASEPAIVAVDAIDRTAKMFIGGKQARPDGGYSRAIVSPSGEFIGHVGEGNRKDIRNAVEAAAKAESWGTATGHARAQILYYCAENLAARAAEFAGRIRQMTGAGKAAAAREVETSIRRLFTYAAWADKYDGLVHNPPLRGVALAMNEPVGVIAIACPDEAPLLAFTSLWAPAVAMGNRVVVVPSEKHPLAATDFYQVLETSDMPDGVVNIVTGARDTLAQVLAEHRGVEAMWYFGPGRQRIEQAAVDDIKQTWTGETLDWFDADAGEGREFLRHATQVKNVWIPYGA